MTEPAPREETPTPLEVLEHPRRGISGRVIAIVTAAIALIAITAVAGVAWSITSSIRAGRDLAMETDRFVAQQYPDYRVMQREPFTNYHGSGEPGNNYFLAKKSEPRFVLLVAVLKPAKLDDRIRALEMAWNGDYLTSDGVFSQKTIDKTWIEESDIDRFVADYVQKMPSPSALIVKTDQVEGSILVSIAGKARYSQALGYLGPFNATHIGQDTAHYDTSGDDLVAKYEYVVTAVEQ